jgi:hypothetical protein
VEDGRDGKEDANWQWKSCRYRGVVRGLVDFLMKDGGMSRTREGIEETSDWDGENGEEEGW